MNLHFSEELTPTNNSRYLNIILAASNIMILFPIYAVYISYLPLSYRVVLYTTLSTQCIVSVAQHLTERDLTPHEMSGIRITKNPRMMEKLCLYTDRTVAGITTIVFTLLVYDQIGVDFFYSWEPILLIWCLILICISDNGVKQMPRVYTMIHIVWHASIYGFLGVVVMRLN